MERKTAILEAADLFEAGYYVICPFCNWRAYVTKDFTHRTAGSVLTCGRLLHGDGHGCGHKFQMPGVQDLIAISKAVVIVNSSQSEALYQVRCPYCQQESQRKGTYSDHLAKKVEMCPHCCDLYALPPAIEARLTITPNPKNDSSGRRWIVCSECQGKKKVSITVPQTCPRCKGKGQLRQASSLAMETCSLCGGAKQIPQRLEEPCPICKGEGGYYGGEKVKERRSRSWSSRR